MDDIKTAIIILNYNGIEDTIECFDSIKASKSQSFQIIIVDNASTDDSMDRLEAHLEKQKTNYHIVSENAAYCNDSVVIIKSRLNRGFSGGNNLGLAFALNNPAINYFWVLNNDTSIDESALDELIVYKEQQPQIGIIGSKLMFYHEPKKIQAIGGVFNKYKARFSQIGCDQIDTGQYDNFYPKMDFVIGASLFVDRFYLEKVGLLAEDYFLYFEEIDWALRGKKEGISVGFCSKSIVYHKQGATTKNDVKGEKNIDAMYFRFKNTLVFYRKFYPLLLPVACITVLFRMMKFAFRNANYWSLLFPVFFQKHRYYFEG